MYTYIETDGLSKHYNRIKRNAFTWFTFGVGGNSIDHVQVKIPCNCNKLIKCAWRLQEYLLTNLTQTMKESCLLLVSYNMSRDT